MNDSLDRFLKEHRAPVPKPPLGHEESFRKALEAYKASRRRGLWLGTLAIAAGLLFSIVLVHDSVPNPEQISEEAFIVETLDDYNQLISSEEVIYEFF